MGKILLISFDDDEKEIIKSVLENSNFIVKWRATDKYVESKIKSFKLRIVNREAVSKL